MASRMVYIYVRIHTKPGEKKRNEFFFSVLQWKGKEPMLTLYLSMLETPQEQDKMEALYCEHKCLMKYTAKQILQDDALAEDAVHDAFLKIISYLDRIQEVQSPRTRAFLVTVVKSTALRLKDKGEQQESVSWKVAPLSQYTPDLMEKIQVDEIVALIRQLPEGYRDVLQLKVNYEFSDRELAELLGLSYSTLRKRLQRAREALLVQMNQVKGGD